MNMHMSMGAPCLAADRLIRIPSESFGSAGVGAYDEYQVRGKVHGIKKGRMAMM
jgi:hypothetical protein